MYENLCFHSEWSHYKYNYIYNGVNILIGQETVNGFFHDDTRFAAKIFINKEPCTMIIYCNHGLFGDETNYYIGSRVLRQCDLIFTDKLPLKIRERYPFLNDMLIEHFKRRIGQYTPVKGLEWAFSSRYDETTKPFRFLACDYDKKTPLAISNDKIEERHLKFIYDSIYYVKSVEIEYSAFKRSRFGKALLDARRKRESEFGLKDIMNIVRIVVKLSVIAGDIPSGNNAPDFSSLDLPDGIDNGGDMMSQLDDNPSLVDYLTMPNDQPDFQGSDGGDISFTGSDSDTRNSEWAAWHEKQAQAAVERGDLSSAHDHLNTARDYNAKLKK